MKVVLFCGGFGMRLREYSDAIPKPMVNIGYRPILWHIMKYYAYYGHRDFILCLGYKADMIKDYFLNYNECISNDFVFGNGGKEIQLLNSDIQDWNITFVDTGESTNVGQRLKAVEKYIGSEDVFIANYSDGLTDLQHPKYVKDFLASGKIATFLCIKPTQSLHVVTMKDNGIVERIQDMTMSDIWINGGFFIFKRDIFKYINAGEELVYEPFRRLIKQENLLAYRYNGFWTAMDTFKDKQRLDDMYSQNQAPWEVWKSREDQLTKGSHVQISL